MRSSRPAKSCFPGADERPDSLWQKALIALPPEGTVSLEKPLAAERFRAGFIALRIKQTPLPAAGRFGPGPGVVCGQSPVDICAPTDIGSATSPADFTQDIDVTVSQTRRPLSTLVIVTSSGCDSPSDSKAQSPLPIGDNFQTIDGYLQTSSFMAFLLINIRAPLKILD